MGKAMGKKSASKTPKKAVTGNASILSFFSKVSLSQGTSKKRKKGVSKESNVKRKRKKGNDGQVVITLSSDSEDQVDASSLFSADEDEESHGGPSHLSVKEEPPLFLPDWDEDGLEDVQDLEEDKVETTIDLDADQEEEFMMEAQGFCVEENVLDCPICNLSLEKMKSTDAERHVNSCLDLQTVTIQEIKRPNVQSKASTNLSPTYIPDTEEVLRSALTSKDVVSSRNTRVTLSTPNAFHSLMQGHLDDKAWKNAALTEGIKGIRGEQRSAPFYKIMDGMQIAVDAFRYGKIEGIKAYFLTHAHSDHYTNLSSSWDHGPIYCSKTTANLIKLKLGVADKWVHALPIDETTYVEGVNVTLIEANHCPGSVLFLFEGPHTDPLSPWTKQPSKLFRYLHCGDFRASPEHLEHPAVKGKKIDICYLDTTYCNPKYTFPSQPLVVESVSHMIAQAVRGDMDAIRKGTKEGQMSGKGEEVMKEWLKTSKSESIDIGPSSKSKVLILVGTYSIGKERMVKGIAKCIGSKIYTNESKAKIFACMDDAELQSLLTNDPFEAQVHVTNLFTIKKETLEEYLDTFHGHFSKIIGLRPTGWTFKSENMSNVVPTVHDILQRESKRTIPPTWFYPQRGSTDTHQMYGVPYSEHSSFFELTCFIISCNCVRIIPTVNVGSEKSRNEMKRWFEKWKAERKKLLEAGEGKNGQLLIKPRCSNYW